MDVLRWVTVALGVWIVSGTALSLTHHPHWYVRGWDFPRVLIAALALICGAAWRSSGSAGWRRSAPIIFPCSSS